MHSNLGGFQHLQMCICLIIFLGLSGISKVYSRAESWTDADDSGLNQPHDKVLGGNNINKQDQEGKIMLGQKQSFEEGANKVDHILHNKSQDNRVKGQLRKTVGHNRLAKGKTMHYNNHEHPKLHDRLNKNKAKSHKHPLEHVVNENNKDDLESIKDLKAEPVKETNEVDGTNNSKPLDANINLNNSEHYLDVNDSDEIEDQNEDASDINDGTQDEPDNNKLLEEKYSISVIENSKNESIVIPENGNRTEELKTNTNKNNFKSDESIIPVDNDKPKKSKVIDTEFIDDLRKTHLNKLIERKLKNQLNHKGYMKDKHLNNFKLSNSTLIDDFQKKLKSIKENTLFNSKFMVSDKKFANTNENSGWMFESPEIKSKIIGKTRNTNEKFGHSNEYDKRTHLKTSKNIREHGTNLSNTSQSGIDMPHPRIGDGYNKQQGKGDNYTITDNDITLKMKVNKVDNNPDHTKRLNKKAHYKTSKNENSNPNFEHFTNRKRNQRDLKGSNSKVNVNKHHKGGFARFITGRNEVNDENEEYEEEGPESVDSSDLEPNYHRQLHTNDDEDYSYKSRSQETDENESPGEDGDTSNESKEMFARRAQESRYNNEISATETCVGYRAGEMATTCGKSTTNVQTTTKSMLSTQRRGNNYTNVKTKNTTSRTVNQTKKGQYNLNGKDFRNQSVPTEALDLYDKFLCGQLIDDFIEAVLVKVRRSPKIQKELGFQNDTEETCDRCIETKLNNIPDREIMKTSLGKCSKSSTKANCFKCYNVPKPMDKFLSLLVSYGKEHETSVYNKLKDESSFIFSGDYPDHPIGSDNGMDNKYNSDSIGKDAAEKDRLREDLNEDKNDDHMSSRHLNEKPNSGQSEYSRDFEEENEGEKPGSNSNLNFNDGNKEPHDESGPHLKPQIRTVTNLRDIDLEEEFDPPVPVRNKFISYKDPELSVSGESASYLAKQMGKSYNQDKQQKKPFYPSNEFKYDTNRQVTPHDGISESGVFDLVASRNIHSDRNVLRGGYQDSNGKSKVFNGDVSNNNLDIEGNPYHKNEFASELRDYDNRIRHKNQQRYNNPFENNPNRRMYPEGNRKVGTYNTDLGVSGSNYDEYPLVPNQNRYSNTNVGGVIGKNEEYDSYLDDGLKMVKRDIEPTDEEETVVFEIPDVEYDLY